MTHKKLSLREATKEDCTLLFRWVNDPEVRRSSLSSEPIDWEEHVAWLTKKLADPSCHIFIASNTAGDPVGQVRFNLANGYFQQALARQQQGELQEAIDTVIKAMRNYRDAQQAGPQEPSSYRLGVPVLGVPRHEELAILGRALPIASRTTLRASAIRSHLR